MILSATDLNVSARANSVVRPSLKRKKPDRNRTIYKFLGHYYIQRRSVVFIVDNEFSGVYYHEKTNKFVNRIFQRLNAEDHFGFIGLSRQQMAYQSPLQKKGSNTTLVKKFLRMMSGKEPELLLQGFGAKGVDERLEIALEKALKW